MPRPRKLKQRADGRYRCKYKGIEFYSTISSEDAIAQREEYKRNHRTFTNQTVVGFAIPWLKRTYPYVADYTYEGLAIHLQHLVDAIGYKRISDVVPSDIKEIYSTQYRDLSNSYIKAAKQLYCSLFDAAVADGLIRYNPARDRAAKPHKGTPPKTRSVTEQEREWILTLCTDHRMYPAVMAMLYAGLRPPEAKALVIERDVDFENDIITVQEFAHGEGQKYAYTGVGKTENAIRQVPLFPPLKEALSGRSGYLIASAHGERVTKTTWRVAWNSYKTCMETAINGVQQRWYGKTKAQKALLDKGELPMWQNFSIVPYNLRHSFCEMCRSAGVEMNTCRKWMGHSDAQMIMKVYDSVTEDRSARERQKVVFGGQNGGQPITK